MAAAEVKAAVQWQEVLWRLLQRSWSRAARPVTRGREEGDHPPVVKRAIFFFGVFRAQGDILLFSHWLVRERKAGRTIKKDASVCYSASKHTAQRQPWGLKGS